MSKQLHTIGNNTAPDCPITKIKQTISALGFDIVEQSCSNPIDNIWSISISDKDCLQLRTNGSGRSYEEALIDALHSFLEKLTTHWFWANYFLGDEVANGKLVHFLNEKWVGINPDGAWPDKVLNSELHDLYNPIGELSPSTLIDMLSSNHKRGICCIPLREIDTNDEVLFPVNLIDNLYANNGIGSGNSKAEARTKALCKVLKNYVQFKVIAEGISLPDIPESILNQYANVQKYIYDIEQAGFSLLIKDASLNGNYPVVNVILLNPNNQSVCNSFASHPDFRLALEHCFSQLFLEKDLSQSDEHSEAGFDMDEISSPKNLEHQFNNSQGVTAWVSFSQTSEYEFSDWSEKYVKNNAAENHDHLCQLILAEGNDIFVTDYKESEIYTSRVIIPSMSEVFPVDDLVWENNNVGMYVREQILKKSKSNDECEQLIESLEDLDLDDDLLVTTLIGMPSDQDSIFHDLCVAELILLLALKVQDNERIQEGCEWILEYKKINQRRLKTYKCINIILQLDGMTNYGTVLEKLYTKEILNDALALIDGEDVFLLNSKWKNYCLLVKAYKKMLKIE